MDIQADTARLRNVRQVMRGPANDLEDRDERDPDAMATMRDREHDARLFGTAVADDMVMGLLTEQGAREAIAVHVALADAEVNLTAEQMDRLARIAYDSAGMVEKRPLF